MLDKGILISFAGIDGAGKTTQAALLCKWFEDQGYNALDMPNIPVFSDTVFDTISSCKGYMDSQELFPKAVVHFAAAIDRVRVFTAYTEKMVEQGAVMIMPEYLYCRMAAAKLAQVQNLNLLSEIYGWLPESDIVFYMDLPSKLALEREAKRKFVEKDSYYLNKLKSCYEELPQYSNFIRIDASKSVQEVQNILRKHIEDYLNKKMQRKLN